MTASKIWHRLFHSSCRSHCSEFTHELGVHSLARKQRNLTRGWHRGTEQYNQCRADEGSWAMIAEDGSGGTGDVVDLGPKELHDQLHVEVHERETTIAHGVVPVADLWAVSSRPTSS